MKNIKKIISAAVASVITAGMLAGCGGESGGSATSGKLVFAIWDNNLMEYIESNDMVGKFREKYPDADIEV